MTSEPLYDEDLINKGYLNKVLNKEVESYTEILGSKNYSTPPKPPTYIGDTWSENGKLYRCKKDRLIGSYNQDDWELIATDDTLANEALTSATNANIVAINAQNTATNAQISATTANNLLSDLSSDNKLTAVEKQTVKKEWDSIVSEVTLNDNQSVLFGITTEKTVYDTSYSNLNTYITPLLTNISTTSDIVGTTFRSNFKAYYDARTNLLNAIATKSKSLADTAQTTANTAIANASTAQTTANNAVASANTANSLLADLSSDSKLTPDEKQSTKKEWDIIVSEVSLNDTQATSFGITTEKTAYDSAYSTLNTYITPLLSSLTTTSDIVGTTFRANFKSYYDTRTNLLNAIATKAKALADQANSNIVLITEQLDKKIETYRQTTDPATNWSTSVEKEKHLGDLWYDTTTQTSKMYIKNGTTYSWAENDVPLRLYDEIDTKKTIYTSKPTTYNINDMWIISSTDTDLPNNTNVGDMLISSQTSTSYNKTHWSKKDNYTPKTYVDTKVEETKTDINNNITNITIPSALTQAQSNARAMLNAFNTGYWTKDEATGIQYLADNQNLSQAVNVWMFGLGGFAHSSTGINGNFNVAITMDGKIAADYILSGTMLANRIKGGVLTLGGTDNINGVFKLLNSSGTEMINMDVEGIKLSNGAKLLGADGLLNVFQYSSGNWQEIGHYNNDMRSTIDKAEIGIDAYIPSNFTIVSAIITIWHAPQYLGNIPYDFGYNEPFVTSWCGAKNLQLYKTSNFSNYARAGIYGSEWGYPTITNAIITDALGSGGFTPTLPTVPPSSSPTNCVSMKTSADIKSSLATGTYNHLIIQTTDSLNYSTQWQKAIQETGLAIATLTVIGYSKQ